RFRGWKEWAVLFSLLYGSTYLLTAIESVYLKTILGASAVVSLLVNGAIVSGVFAFALVELLAKEKPEPEIVHNRLTMPRKEWAWKILCSGALYLLLFIVFGLAIYAPLARAIDPSAYASEQASISASAAGLVFPLEFLRGIIWTTLAVLATFSLPYDWKKTSVVVGLLLAVPISVSVFLSSAIVPGLQVAHFAELFGENLVFGIAAVWILHLHSRLRELTAVTKSTKLSTGTIASETQ
ncbi:MAG: hypothetical protein OK439_03565, partial [Thaumarchaeota archaeon]|nr:hypothetical protein [Nitrososphaerota archaeon]